jgi:hypothetical protein
MPPHFSRAPFTTRLQVTQLFAEWRGFGRLLRAAAAGSPAADALTAAEARWYGGGGGGGST